MKKLPVHAGCVNTICWNKTGEFILSGSDDCNLCITKPTCMFDSSQDYSVLHKIGTCHLGNIFSAQFMPNSGDSLIVSCSSEGPVLLHDVNSLEPSQPVLNFNCHSSTIHRVAIVPSEDTIFLSCGEDKTIRLFDMRLHSSCARAGTCPHPALIRNSSAMTTLDVHPLNSNLLLVGRADGMGLVYDRRRLPDVRKFSREKAHQDRLAGKPPDESFKYMHPMDGVVAQFTVPDLDEKRRFTSLCYNDTGSEVLANYSKDYIYLFRHDSSSNVELIQTLPKKTRPPSSNNGSEESDREQQQAAEGSLTRGSRISRIRVRSDWSDTGVNSVPQSRARDASHSPSFWQHMMDVAFNLSSDRSGDRPRSVPTSRSPRGGENPGEQGENQAQEEPMDEDSDEDNDGEDIDEDDIIQDIIFEEDEEYDSENGDGALERFAEDTVENLVNDVTDYICNSESNQSAESRPKISTETKMKFKKTLDQLKDKYNRIPNYNPCIKYQGHRNCRTSLKQATFWGDDYIMSGSDDGRIIIWEKETAKLMMAFPADERVVNCLAPNPHHYVLASSGIDYDVKLWSTQGLLDGPLRVSDEEMARIVETNEEMLEDSKKTISVPPHLFLRVLASLAHMNQGGSRDN